MSDPQIFETDIKEDENGDQYIEFSDELMKTVGWEIGDTLEWSENKDGSWSLLKTKETTETEWVMVECISTFRQRYMVQVPKEKSEWALDIVTMEEATEFSSVHLGEQIVSHRTISKEEALELCDIDNDYSAGWDEETKMKNFFTTWNEEENGNEEK